MRAPLIAVISVGIAAAAPAVAVSADTKAGAKRSRQAASAPAHYLHQAPGPVVISNPTNEQMRHRRLVLRFLRLRNRTNRLIARRDGRKVRVVRTTAQARWSVRRLRRALRVLRKRIRRVRADLRFGLTPAARAMLERIAACESKGNPRAVGGGGSFRGKYQFSIGTWQAVGGSGDPAAAPEAEQDRRAALLLKRSGTSPWPVCG